MKTMMIFLMVLTMPYLSFSQTKINMNDSLDNNEYYFTLIDQYLEDMKSVFNNTAIVTIDTMGKDSLITRYYENRQLYYQIPYKNGYIDGNYEQYYSNGQLHFRKPMVKGKIMDGYFYYYWMNGSISEEGQYKNNVRTGKWVSYSFGHPNRMRIYDRKGILKKVKDWDENKQKWVKGGIRGYSIEINGEKIMEEIE